MATACFARERRPWPKRQVIVRNGAAIERLATANVAVLDKTGTLTIGKPVVRDVTPAPSFTRAKRLAAVFPDASVVMPSR